jgi:hypothetical protein
MEPKTRSVLPDKKAVGLPRWFSVGTLMILMCFFAVLFAIMKILDVHWIIFTGVSLFFGGVGASQSVFFKGHYPRKASWISGLFLGPVIGILMIIIGTLLIPPAGLQQQRVADFASGLIFLGGPFGYVAGCLIAGIFLVREREGDEE